MGKLMTLGIGATLLLAVGGCGAATVDGTAADAATRADARPADLGALDLGAPSIDVGAADAPPSDAPPSDALARDAAPEARACPVVDDVPAPDVPASDAPYVVELSLSAILQQCARMSDSTVRCRGWNHAYPVATPSEKPCSFAGQNRPRLAVFA